MKRGASYHLSSLTLVFRLLSLSQFPIPPYYSPRHLQLSQVSDFVPFPLLTIVLSVRRLHKQEATANLVHLCREAMDVCSPYSSNENKRSPCPSESPDPLWVPNCSPSFFDGPASASMVNFEGISANTEKIKGKYDDEFDHQTEKKRRLREDQVHLLEKSFEVENKLEPDRKLQLAEEVGLQPKQVAIWFQNRRARSKSKLLEKEYDSLKVKYDQLKADYDTIRAENNELKNEVHLLSKKLSPREAGIDFPFLSSGNTSNTMRAVVEKQDEAASLVKSDVFDPDGARCTSASVETADSSDESLSTSFLQPLCFPDFGGECGDDLQPNPCNFGFPVQDQGTWVWRY